MRLLKFFSVFILAVLAIGCQSTRPIYTVENVDLERFMGAWYVIASIPTFIEKDAYNAVESYRLEKNGTVATTFTFNKADFDGKLKTYQPKGFVVENPIYKAKRTRRDSNPRSLA